jgi:hypothetical protein
MPSRPKSAYKVVVKMGVQGNNGMETEYKTSGHVITCCESPKVQLAVGISLLREILAHISCADNF